MKQELFAGVILGVIGPGFVLAAPAKLWTMTEKWKTKDGSQS